MPPRFTKAEKEYAIKLAQWRRYPVKFVKDVFGVDPDPWQAKVLQAFPKNQRIAMKAPIDNESIAFTLNGQKRWGDVQIGDMVFAEDGSPTRVMNRFDVSDAQMYRVKFRDGTSLRVSGDHEWDVQTPYDRVKGKRRTVSTDQLRSMNLRNPKTDQRLVSIPRQEPAQFNEVDLPLDPYVFGLWLGDGNANEARLTCPDHSIRSELVKRGQRIGESSVNLKRIGLLGVAGGLRATGMMKCRSYEKSIPDLYKYASVEQRLDLLRGLMDSDGTTAKNGHTYLASCSKELIDDFIWLARSLGYMSKCMGPYKINDGENRDSYRATICGPICPFLADTMKKQRWKKPIEGKTLRFIESIEPDGHGDAMCIEVAHPSHCFQAEDFIVTHNCKGPGKTCVLAWLCWLFLLTRAEAKILCTSITKGNMQSGLWPEMSKWQQKSKLLLDQFEWFSESIKHKQFGSNWFMHMKPWPNSADPEQQANTLAGMHADNIMFVLDEAGGIPDAVMVAAEAALTGGEGTYQRIIMAGNPTHREGPLWRACSTSKHMWWTISITSDPDDPLRTPRVSKEWARGQIEQYGRHNPWVMVNVFGEFPQTSMNTLLSEWEVDQAMKRNPRKEDYMYVQKRLGIDVARFGDDRTVICARQGLKVSQFKELRNERTTDIANVVYDAKMKWGSECEYVDGTGGYGAGVIDCLRLKKVYAQEIMFSGKALDSRKFYNKRAEMWWKMAEWVKSGGALPFDAELKRELSAVLYFYTGDRIQIEPKDNIKKRVGNSPDKADALALTFADDDMSSQIITDDYGVLDETRVKLLMHRMRDSDTMETEYDHLSGF